MRIAAHEIRQASRPKPASASPSPRPSRGEGWGERLSGESSCIGVLGSRIACFGIEADEQFASERNSDDHFFLSGGHQSGAELAEALVVAGGDGGDQEQDRTHAGTSATN